MASLRELRSKLQSVHNIQKITQAMEMVAAARLKRAQAKAELSRPYARKLKSILNNLIASSDDFDHPLVLDREVKRLSLVIISSDRGLCGSYNQNIFSAAEKWLKKYQPDQVELTLIGRKAVEHFSGKKWHVAATVPEWGGKIAYPEIEAITNRLIAKYIENKIDEAWILYTHYINISSRTVKFEKLLNVEHTKDENTKESFNTIFEPNISEIFTAILPRVAIAKLQTALSEAYASELGARIFSMRAATKNAKEMIEDLTLVRNKIRQAGITRDLIEITSCVESLK